MKRDFRSSESGMSAVEMAILLPFLILLVMAVIEFGIYFVKYQIATRAVSNISDTIQKDSTKATYSLATQQGLSLLDLTNLPNYICAKSYADELSATRGLCSSGWDVGAPFGLPSGASYYVAIRAYSPHASITPFTALSKNFPPPIDIKSVITVSSIQSSTSQKVCVGTWSLRTQHGSPYAGDGATFETYDSSHIRINVPANWTKRNCYDYMEPLSGGSNSGLVWSLECVFANGSYSRGANQFSNYGYGNVYSPAPSPSPNCGW